MKSLINKCEAHLFTKGDLETRDFVSFSVPLWNIFSMVSGRKELKGYDNLKYSILCDGMKTPIILLNNTKENWLMAIRQVKREYLVDYDEWDTYAKYIAYSGNQRIEVAKEQEFGKISCMLAEDVHWAHALHLVLENESSIK